MKPNRKLILMTGTPLTTPMDVYGYCRLTNPNAYRSKGVFEMMHVAKRDNFENVVEWLNEDKLQDEFLFNSARVFRREIDENLPEVTYEPIPYELDAEHYKAYQDLAKTALLEINKQEKIDATTIQKLNNMLQQIIVGYETYFEDETQRVNAHNKVAAFTLLDEVMESLGDRKLIVFAYFQRAIESLQRYGEKYQSVAIYGGMTDKKRQQSLDQFINNPDCRLLIGQPISMGSGLDSLKNVCSDILFLELPMVAKDFTQAVGRIDRNGQKKHCHVRVACAVDTLQVRRQKNLLDKDVEANKIQLTHKDLKDWVFGK